MRFRYGWLLAALLVALPAWGHAGEVLDRAKARGALVAAAVPDALPQAARDASGALQGFDIDVASEIAKRLGLSIRFVTPSWQDILEGDWGDRWDASVSSMTPTPECEKRLEFPAIYRLEAAVLVAHKDNASIQAPTEASGKTVGTKENTTYEQYLRHTLTIYRGEKPFAFVIQDPVIRLYPSKEEALDALAKGDGQELDATVTSYAHAQGAIASGAPLRIVENFLFFEPLAVVIDKGDDEFVAAIRQAVSGMHDDGSLSALSIKWLGIDLTS